MFVAKKIPEADISEILKRSERSFLLVSGGRSPLLSGHMIRKKTDLVDRDGIVAETTEAEQSLAAPSEGDKTAFGALIGRIAKHKDRQAFITLFDYFAPRVKSFLMGAGAITEDIADDLVQDVMLTVWRKADQYDPSKAVASTWIFTIARNRRIDYLRRVRPEVDSDAVQIETEAEDSPLEHFSTLQNAEILRRAVADLPPEQLDLIRRAFYQDKPHSAIAEETNIPLGTVKSRIRLALEKIRKTLKDGGFEA